MRNIKYDTVGTILKSKTKIVEKEAKSIPLTHIHYMTLTLLAGYRTG
jgi:hypothetical protein